jgi:hypothetical protein
MKLEANQKACSGKRTRNLGINYFYLTGLIKENEIRLNTVQQINMVADYMTKPVVEAKFKNFCNRRMDNR